MALGFIGTGTIAAAMVQGLSRAGNTEPIVVSPRNAQVAASLAAALDGVIIASSNQQVLDQCDTVFIAVRPQVVDAVMADLRFEPHHCVVSLVATVSLARLAGLAGPAAKLYRAVPLPFVASGLGGTLLYPANATLAAVFDQLGQTIVVRSEADIDVLTVASSTMSAYFASMATLERWLTDNGIAAEAARAYLAQLGMGLAAAATADPSTSYVQLVDEFATPGGLNEQFRKHLEQSDLPQHYRAGLDALLTRITGR
ncbi:MAG TPA: pyrroline-5-carboxylate reductase [Devosia sp.]|nr:pyrroline-5-carboxylate reductase [Devosia sp.]